MGRPTRLTRELIKEIADDVRRGLTLASAAETKGIPRKTCYGWMKRGEAAKSGLFREFHDAIMKAEAERASALIRSAYEKALSGDIRAAFRLLESYEPESWASEQRVKLEHSGEISIEHKLSDEFLATLPDSALYMLGAISIRQGHWEKANGNREEYERLCREDESLRWAEEDAKKYLSGHDPLGWRRIAKQIEGRAAR